MAPEPTYQIQSMRAEDVRTAIHWAGNEGWNPGLHDAETFFAADNSGFFKGVLAGEVVATGSAIIYDDTYAFCGLYIVAPDHRGKGYGLELTKARLTYCGDRNVGIDGVLENVRIYERIGYEAFYENCRYQKTANAAHIAPEIRTIKRSDFSAVKTYDRQCFPAARDAFLEAWLWQADGRAIGFFEDGTLKGYALRRKCLEGHKVGPLFADNADVAVALFDSLQGDIEGELIILDTPKNNAESINLAKSQHMEKIFATARMYQKGLPAIDAGKIFGITTFELG